MMIHPDFGALVQRIIQTVEKDRLSELRRDFHTRLRLTLTQPDNTELIEDLWDFFYDWCVFEKQIPELVDLSEEENTKWNRIRSGNLRGLFIVTKASDSGLKLKDLLTGKVFVVPAKSPNDYLGISRGDILEARLIPSDADVKNGFAFVRRPSYHPIEVHNYIKAKVRHFKKIQDAETYHSWLWILAGMYLKHRLYPHMPIDRIYDDNSRI
jgi:hypothetical protein